MKTRSEIIDECVEALRTRYNKYADMPMDSYVTSSLRVLLLRVLQEDITTKGWDSTTAQLMLDSGSWHSAFEEAMCCISPAPPYSKMSLDVFTIGDVVGIQHIREGENETMDWICIGQLKDGRWFNLEAGCDYTGWDCEANGQVVVADSYDVLMRLGCKQETRSLFGYSM
jgi:hypothetical protein